MEGTDWASGQQYSVEVKTVDSGSDGPGPNPNSAVLSHLQLALRTLSFRFPLCKVGLQMVLMSSASSSVK